jgi:hypothetical protein
MHNLKAGLFLIDSYQVGTIQSPDPYTLDSAVSPSVHLIIDAMTLEIIQMTNNPKCN